MAGSFGIPLRNYLAIPRLRWKIVGVVETVILENGRFVPCRKQVVLTRARGRGTILQAFRLSLPYLCILPAPPTYKAVVTYSWGLWVGFLLQPLKLRPVLESSSSISNGNPERGPLVFGCCLQKPSCSCLHLIPCTTHAIFCSFLGVPLWFQVGCSEREGDADVFRLLTKEPTCIRQCEPAFFVPAVSKGETQKHPCSNIGIFNESSFIIHPYFTVMRRMIDVHEANQQLKREREEEDWRKKSQKKRHARRKKEQAEWGGRWTNTRKHENKFWRIRRAKKKGGRLTANSKRKTKNTQQKAGGVGQEVGGGNNMRLKQERNDKGWRKNWPKHPDFPGQNRDQVSTKTRMWRPAKWGGKERNFCRHTENYCLQLLQLVLKNNENEKGNWK